MTIIDIKGLHIPVIELIYSSSNLHLDSDKNIIGAKFSVVTQENAAVQFLKREIKKGEKFNFTLFNSDLVEGTSTELVRGFGAVFLYVEPFTEFTVTSFSGFTIGISRESSCSESFFRLLYFIEKHKGFKHD
jgi:hypothetical protein